MKEFDYKQRHTPKYQDNFDHIFRKGECGCGECRGEIESTRKGRNVMSKEHPGFATGYNLEIPPVGVWK